MMGQIMDLCEDADLLVVNAVSLLNKSLPILKAHDHVILFLDNDDAGKKSQGSFNLKRDRCPGCFFNLFIIQRCE
jgi:hypothetical protein